MQRVSRREAGAMDDEIEAAELAIGGSGDGGDLLIARHVAWPAHRSAAPLRELAHALCEPLAATGQHAMRAAGAEAILTAGRLPDGELRDRTRGWLLSFRPGKGRSNEGAMDRALFKSRIAFVVATFVAGVFSSLVDRGKHFGDAARRLG